MREICQSGSEGGARHSHASFLPLSRKAFERIELRVAFAYFVFKIRLLVGLISVSRGFAALGPLCPTLYLRVTLCSLRRNRRSKRRVGRRAPRRIFLQPG
jgi:hypothetical protein